MVKRRALVILPVIIVILTSIIGIGYALVTGDVENNGNTDLPEYTVITPQGIHAYSGGFSNNIRLDTENRNGTVTFSIAQDQITQITVSQEEKDVVLLGELLFNVEQTNMSEDYIFSMNNIAGTMTGTFYMGISTSEDNDTFSSWEYKAYTIGTGSSFNVDNEIEWVNVRLYVDSSFQTSGGSLATSPLQNVTFKISATVED